MFSGGVERENLPEISYLGNVFQAIRLLGKGRLLSLTLIIYWSNEMTKYFIIVSVIGKTKIQVQTERYDI